MERNDERRRQELVATIESGRYKTGHNAAKSILIVFGIMYAFIAISMIAVSVRTGNTERLGLMLIMGLFMFWPVWIGLIAAWKFRGTDLGKLTPRQRWLILNGDKIEADLDAIDSKGSLFVISCSADYAGQRMQFVSPSISVKPIPFDERKIDVYINPQNPRQYLIDIYSHLPLAGDHVLHDRSEMQVDLNKKNPNQSATIILIVICFIFFIPFMIFGLLAGVGEIAGGNTASGVVIMTMSLLIAGLVFYGTLSMSKKNQSLTANGYYIPATALKFWVTHSKNNTTYHLSARYIEPSTKQVHEFRTTGPRAMKDLVGTKVNTFINPENTREYFMDVRGALERMGFTTSRETGK